MNAKTESPTAPRSRAWLWFFAVAVLQAFAWTTWLIVASQHRVPEVPLATAPIRASQPAIHNR